MATIKYGEVKQMVEHLGSAQTCARLGAAIREKHLKAEDFSLKDLAEAIVPEGREWVASMSPFKSGFQPIREAANAIDTSAFSNIAGQIVYSKLLDAYQSPAFIGDQLCTTIPTKLSGEKIAGVTNLGDAAAVVDEGMPYLPAGVAEDWIETPATTKRGLYVPVTREAIFFDRTNLILDRAAKVGESLGINKEKRILDCVIDGNVTTHRYRWKGTQIATYGDNSGTHTWDNNVASNALVDWSDINDAEQAFVNMTDPHTGEPILLMASTLLVCPNLKATAMRIVNAIEIRFGDGASASTQTISRNPVTPYQIITSPLLAARVSAASQLNTTWYLGDPKKAFAYMENWPVTVTTAPVNSEAEFMQDIVLRYKASERGAAATLDPRYMVRNLVA